MVVSYRMTSSAASGLISATSQPVHVTWDLGATIREITNALSASLAAPPSGGDSGPSGQTADRDPRELLLDCVHLAPSGNGGGISYASFAALMTHYTGNTKTLLDSGTCATQFNNAWEDIATDFSSTFTMLSSRTGNNAAAINAFLSSEPGQSFKAYMLSRTSLTGSIEDFIVPAAGVMAREPTGTPSGAGGQNGGGGTTNYVASCLLQAGIGAQDNANAAKLPERLATLNCLIFGTPHSYWLGLANNSGLEAYKTAVNGVNWLSYGDLECSFPILGATRIFADFGDSAAEKAACLKHDLSWSSLQAMAGNTMLSESQDDNELDRAHNPRNKFLADFTFYVENVCESETGAARRNCLASPDRQTEVLGGLWALASPDYRRFWAVSQSPFTHRGWPVTREDMKDAYKTPMYVDCNPPTPSATGLRLSVHDATNRYHPTVRVEYQSEDNCSEVGIDHISLCPSALLPCIEAGANGLFKLQESRREIFVAFIYLYPENRVYGGVHYTIELNRTILIE